MSFTPRAGIMSGLLAGLASAFAVSPALAADWSNTSIGVSYGRDYREPVNPEKIAKTIYNMTHVSGDKWGTNLLSGDIFVSNSKDPANNSVSGNTDGAVEIYTFYRRTLSLNALTDNAFASARIKDVSLSARVDMGTKNSALAPRPRKVRLGALVDLPIDKGFWQVGVDYYRESTNNNFFGGSFSYDPTWATSTSWSVPFGIGTFGGFVDVIGKKGTHGTGPESAVETMARATYMIPVGRGFDVGVGFEYWKNKYGVDNKMAMYQGGATNKTAMLLAQYRF